MNLPAPLPRNLVVISGAGLSAESGLSTFRDANGMWDNFDINEVCNYNTWRRNRDAVYAFYGARKVQYAAATPSHAHLLLAEWQKKWGSERVKLLTQNVDDLLERAGAANVTHLHGSLSEMVCEDCFLRFDIGDKPISPNLCCPQCGRAEPVKPGVVFFGESSPTYNVLREELDSLTNEDVLLIIGTSMQVLTAARLVPPARQAHALTWQVNPVPVQPELFGSNVAAPAGEGLSRLEERLTALMTGQRDPFQDQTRAAKPSMGQALFRFLFR